MECRAMNGTPTKPTTNPNTCPLSAFDGIPWGQIPTEGRARIYTAYKSYFDTLDPRRRAIGYCIIMGGISTRRIGTLGVMLCRDAGGKRLFGITLNGRIAMVDDVALVNALYEYVNTETRFTDAWNAIPASGHAVLPLFVALVHARHEALKDCMTFMWNASKAIGYSARAISANKMAPFPFIPLQWKPDDPRYQTLFEFLANMGEMCKAIVDATREPGDSHKFYGFCGGLMKIDA